MTTLISAAAPADVIAYSWFAMGFRPRESLVVVGLDGARRRAGLVARVDLPPPRQARRAARSLAEVLDRGRADACSVYVVSDASGTGPLIGEDGSMPHRGLVERLLPALVDLGLEVVDVALVGPEAFRSYLCDDQRCCPASGTPLDAVTTGPVAAAMVLEGRTVRGSEHELVADVDPETAAACGEALLEPPSGRPGRARRRAVLERWCADLDADAQEPTQPQELLTALTADRDVRDALLYALVPGGRAAAVGLAAGRRTTVDDAAVLATGPEQALADAGNRLLAAVARRTPQGHRAGPLAMLAWIAWWSGDGVRGRLLATAALEEDPGHRLGALVEALLGAGVPPPWTAVRDG